MSVDGILYECLTDEEIEKLDAWEDNEYKRVEVVVNVLDKSSSEDVPDRVFAYEWNSDSSLLYGIWSFQLDFQPLEEDFLETNCKLEK